MINKLIYIKKEGYIPDVIILEWTQILMIAHEIKAIFPNIPIAVSEHDVTFLSYQRKWEHAKGVLGKKVNKMLYEAMKAKELYEISACDLVYTQSEKDSNLLVGNGVPQEKVFTITPYYETFSEVSSKHNTKDIIFYGAMDRAENYKSAIWFIDHVMPELTKWNIRFIVIGNRPNKSLLKRKAANIIITGFVAAEELRGYFSNCLCMAAPLVIGGGIKVKVLEAMSAGVVVLTNHIGIEGIPAKDNESYIFCNTPEEYINVVRKILDHRLDEKKIGENARTLVSNIFSQNRSFEYWRKRIHELGVKN